MMTLIMAAKETSYFGEDLLVFLLSLFGKWGVLIILCFNNNNYC